MCIGLSPYANPYYSYFLVWTAACLLLGWALSDLSRIRSDAIMKQNLLCIGLAGLIMIPYVHQNFLMDTSNSYTADTPNYWGDNLYYLTNYSARPSDYILPNVHNAWFGEYFHRFVSDATNARNIWSDEFAVSIGILPTIFLVLLMATWLTRARAISQTLSPWLSQLLEPIRQTWHKERALSIGLLLTMLVSFLISLPPHLTYFGIEIPMPNELLRRIMPFRSYSRFALVFLVAESILIALVVGKTKYRGWLTTLLVAACVFESFPKTMLHPVSAETPYIKFLRSRPEHVIMRFDRQNVNNKRILDLEVMLTDKKALNGDVNYKFGYTELPLIDGFPKFNIGLLGIMGAELLIVDGKYNPAPKDLPYLEQIGEFPENNIQIWKIHPATNPRLERVFAEIQAEKARQHCGVVPKAKTLEAIEAFVETIRP